MVLAMIPPFSDPFSVAFTVRTAVWITEPLGILVTVRRTVKLDPAVKSLMTVFTFDI
jgi:hypothetical protein